MRLVAAGLVALERFLLLCARCFLPAARTPMRACGLDHSSNMINAISRKRNVGAAQSKASNESKSAQVRQRARTARSKVVCFIGMFL